MLKSPEISKKLIIKLIIAGGIYYAKERKKTGSKIHDR